VRAAGLSGESLLAGRTGLAELATMVAGASLVISNDTGVAHLAVAFGTPSVTLFGPVSPALWGPPPDARRHLVLWKGSGARPGDAHGSRADPRLLRIETTEVLNAARRLLPRRVTLRSGGRRTGAGAPRAVAGRPPQTRGSPGVPAGPTAARPRPGPPRPR
jgi:Glycosyltransferase family 9 (heptosyltransferase)